MDSGPLAQTVLKLMRHGWKLSSNWVCRKTGIFRWELRKNGNIVVNVTQEGKVFKHKR